MLIRFLSYYASIIGARRYKPLIISCLAVLLSITGISIMASTISDSPSHTVSNVGQTSNASQPSEPEQTSAALGDMKKRQTKEDPEKQAPQPASAPDDSSRAAAASANNKKSAGERNTFDIVLNTAMVNLSAANQSAGVTVKTTDGTAVQWSILPIGEAADINARTEQVKELDNNAVVRFHAETSAAPGTYQFSVQATDARHGTAISKIITVTISS